MKNIHLIPTDKPTGIFESKNGLHFSIIEKIRYGEFKGFHIYITNDEEIKEGDWYLIEFNGLKITQCTSVEELISIEGRDDCKKIILTTDQDLIADGVKQISEDVLLQIVEHINSGKNIESFDKL
jgi:hypothetical protein